jgi:hypothetical protein
MMAIGVVIRPMQLPRPANTKTRKNTAKYAINWRMRRIFIVFFLLERLAHSYNERVGILPSGYLPACLCDLVLWELAW